MGLHGKWVHACRPDSFATPGLTTGGVRIESVAVRILYENNVEIPMRDGVILRADVWRRDDDEPHPAVVVRTPYQKEEGQLGNDVFRYNIAALKGYAVVVQDTRGRFASDGVWTGLMWDQEVPDGYDTVEWTAEQSWCDGNVGMWGVSYLAGAAWLTAMERPPHLRAIIAGMIADAPTEEIETGGAISLDLLLTWFVYQLMTDVVPKQIAAGTAHTHLIERLREAARDPRVVFEHLPLADAPHLAVPGSPVTLTEVMERKADMPPEFRYEQVEVPVLIYGGWFDLWSYGVPEQFRSLRRLGGGGESVKSKHRMILGPWAHGGLLRPTQGELNMGLEANGRLHLTPSFFEFFDRHLMGKGADVAPVRYFVIGPNEWRQASDWPPPGCVVEKWYLHSGGKANTASGDGVLTKAAPTTAEGGDEYKYDPADPVPTHGGTVIWSGSRVGGPLNQAHLETRHDVLCYTTPPLEDAFEIVGPVVLHLFAESDARDTDFVGKLIDVYPDGRSILIGDGSRRARYRHGFDTEEWLEPGRVEHYEILLGQTGWRIDRGHRLRVHVTSSNFPRIDRNMNTGGPVGSDAAGIVASQTIHHTVRHPSRLEISVLSGP